MTRFALLVVSCRVVTACSGSDEALERANPPRTGDPCASYQDALCDWVTRCRPEVARSSCDEVAQSIVCATDGRTEGCLGAIDAAGCASPPNDCELVDVADRGPARAACEAYLVAVCDRSVRCGAETRAECQSSVEAALDCDRVVGVKARLEECLADLAADECGEAPESCDELLVGE